MAVVSGYDGFISYSHQDDALLGPALKTNLERFAKPWYKMRALRIFLDTADLGANPGLWPSIVDGLSSSQWFILLASAGAAESKWVNREAQWWMEHGSRDRLLVVGTSPGLAWDDEKRDWAANAPVPAALHGAFRDEPHWIDLSKVQLDSGRPRISAHKIAAVAAPLRGKHLDELIGEHLRQHRRAMRLAEGAVAVMAVLTALAVVFSIFAVRERNNAIVERNQALSREVLAQVPSLEASQPGLARQLAVSAYQLDPTDQADATLLTGLSIPGMLTQQSDVNALAYDPRQPVIAIATADTIELEDSSDGAVLRAIPGSANLLVFSHDGRLLAASEGGGAVQLWNVSDPAHPVMLGRTGDRGSGASAIAFASDDSMLGVSYLDNTAIVWNLSAPARPTLLFYIGQASAIAFGPGSMVAAGGNYYPGNSAVVDLWRLTLPAHLTPVGTLKIPTPGQYQGVTALAFSPDGRSLVVGTIWGDAIAPAGGGGVIANIADPAKPQLVNLQINEAPAQAAYSPDGSTLALRASAADTGSGDIYLWDVAALEPVDGTTIPGSSGTTAGMAFSPDSSTLAVGGGERILLWRVTNPILPAALATIPKDITTQPDPTVDALAFSLQRHLLVTGSRDGLTHVWNVADPSHPSLVGTIPAEPDRFGPVIYSVAISSDGRFVATGGDMVRLWNVSNLSRPSLVWTDPDTGAVSSLVFSPDGKLLASSSNGGPPLLWHLGRPGKPVSLPAPHGIQSASPLTFAPTGPILVGQSIGHIWEWNVANPTRPVVVSGSIAKIGNGNENPQESEITSEAESSDGHVLAIALPGVSPSTALVQLWHLEAPGLEPTLAGTFLVPGADIGSLAFSPDGNTLATAGSDLSLWDVTDPADVALLATFPGTLAVLATVAFSPDGSTLAVSSAFDGNADNVVDLWDVSDASLQRLFCQDVGTPISQTQWQTYFGSVAYNPACGAT